MRRRGRRGTGGAQDGQSWPEPPWNQEDAPWELPGWEEEGSFPPGEDEGLPEEHPSGPMPAVSSRPRPPRPDDPPPGYHGSQPPPPGGLPPGYRGRHRGIHDLPESAQPGPPSSVPPQPGPRSPVPPQPGPPAPGSPYPGQDPGARGHYPGAGVPGPRPGGYDDTGYQDTGYQDPGEYPRGDSPGLHDTGPTGPLYPGDSYPGAPYQQESLPPSDSWEQGYPADRYAQTGDYPTGPGYAAGTDSQGVADYSDEEYGGGDGYADDSEYLDDPGYHDGAAEDFAADQGVYDTGYQPGAPVGGYGDEIGQDGYRQPPEWYGDVDDERGWPEDQYSEEGFLPGLDTGADTRQRDSGPGTERAPAPAAPARGGGKRGGTARAAGKPAKRKRGFRRIAPWLALAVVLAMLGAAGGGYYYIWHTYLHPADYSGDGTGSVTVQIKPGDAAATVGERLQALGVVASARAFENAAKASGQGSALEPGFYRLHEHMKASLAFALLLKPSSREQVKVTIPEGLRASRTISVLGRVTGELKAYQQALKDVTALKLPAAAHGNPEGYLFPATYQIQPGTKPLSVLQAMVLRFDQEAADVNLKVAAARGQLTESEVITVASLIQAEGRHLSDFPKIAEVIYNRLNDHMKLQLDSTVLFALNKYGILANNSDLQVNSSYNTYQRYGLPPGPIDSPGDAAIRAALHPDHGNLLYFVTVNPKTGLTKFTDNLTQFNQWKAELEQALSKG
jgi:peptidoglycan lytic transglycosylase G